MKEKSILKVILQVILAIFAVRLIFTGMHYLENLGIIPNNEWIFLILMGVQFAVAIGIGLYFRKKSAPTLQNHAHANL